MPSTTVTRLELDLDVFAGPFDLLLSLILREELDLLEVELAEIVLAYLDHLEARDELDLESATEFLVLIAALLELKSRLMLPGEEIEELDELAPAEAAEELLERMLAYARFRGAGGFLAARREAEQGVLYRSAPLPPALRRAPLEQAEQAYDPAVLGQALGGLLRTPPPIDLQHIAMPRVALSERLAVLRALLRRGTFSFDEAVEGADRMTVAVTLFALLELYKRGEADWDQGDAFGPITVRAEAPPAAGTRSTAGGGVMELERQLEALLFLAPDPVPVEELADALRVEEDEVAAGLHALGVALEGRGLVLRELAGGWTLASHPDAEEAARRLLARPRTPGLTPGPGRDPLDRRLPAAGLAAGGGPDPRRGVRVGDDRARRPRADRGGRPLAVRRRALSHHAAVPEAVRPQDGRRAARPVAVGPEPGGAVRAARPAAARGRGARGHRGRGGRRSRAAAAASWPHAASMSRPRVSRTVARSPCSSSTARNASIAPREEPPYIPVGLYGMRLTLKTFGSSSRVSWRACS